jgi:hypothetical protein
MTFAKIATLAGVLVMITTLTYGFAAGDFWGDGRVLMSVAWGQVTMVDIYVGFVLFCGWVAFREPSRWRAAVWIVLVLTLGNFLTCVYTFAALVQSRGNWTTFWMGARAASN